MPRHRDRATSRRKPTRTARPSAAARDLQELTDDVPVVERDRAVGELLALLVALAGDEDDVAASSLGEGRGDRFLPVDDRAVLAAPRCRAGLDLAHDRLGTFA